MSSQSSSPPSGSSPPNIPPKSPKRKSVTVVGAGTEPDAPMSAPRPDPSSLGYTMSLSPSPTGQLPQLGFGAVYNFDQLVEADNRFLFRVYTPKTRPNHPEYQFDDPSDPYFLGYKFKDRDDAEQESERTIPTRQRRLSSMSFSGVGTGSFTPRRGGEGDSGDNSDSDTAVMSSHSWSRGHRRSGSMSVTSSPSSRPLHHRSSSVNAVARPPRAHDDLDALKSFESVARYMDWKTRSSSPYVSTTFSFAYALWDAVKRYKMGVKHDIEIAVIDARAVKGRAVTALELLRKANTKQKGKNYWQWYRFATEAQDVLVFGNIPGEAIYASVPLTSLLPKLPSYFFKEADTEPFASLSDMIDPKLFDHLAWEIGDSKRQRRLSRASSIGASPNDKYTAPSQTAQDAPSTSHRAFCSSLSSNFMQLPSSLRLGDSTNSATRLALAFLHPWFHARVHSDPEDAADVLAALALAIARWPAEWWVRDRAGEVEALVRGAVRVMVEEASEGGVMGVEMGEELKRLWEASNNEERERTERSRAGTPGVSRAPSPGPAAALNGHNDASSERVATRPSTPDPSQLDNNPLANSQIVRPTSPSASPGLRSPTPSRRRGSISSPNFGFEHVRRPGSALSFRSELDHIPDVPGDVDTENRDARSRNVSRMGSLRARSPSPGAGGILSSMTPPGTPGSPPIVYGSGSLSASASGLGRRRSRLSQSFETDLGGSWAGSGSWSAAASAKYDGDSEGSGDGGNGSSGAKLSRRDSGTSTNGAIIGRGPRKISFADEADVKLLRRNSSGSGGGDKSPGLAAAFGEEIEKLARQGSIEEEDERLEEKVSTSSKTTTPQRRDGSAEADEVKSFDEPAADKQEPDDDVGGLGLTTDEHVQAASPQTHESRDLVMNGDAGPSDVVGRTAKDLTTVLEPVNGDARIEPEAGDTEDANAEPELIYRESDRMYRSAHTTDSESERSLASSNLPSVWPWEITRTSSSSVDSPRYVNAYEVFPNTPLYRHIHDVYGPYGGILTVCIPVWVASVFTVGASMLLFYSALLPRELSNQYW